MTSLRLLPFCLLLTTAALADGVFPGLRSLLTDAEWKRAGLERLTPDQIGVIDAALIRHQVQETKRQTAQPPLASAPANAPAPGATPVETVVNKSRFWDRFGLGKSSTPDWRTVPPMVVKVTGWQGANRFVLETGQVWEGLDMIPYELLGREVIIEARPMDAFALKLDENSAVVRVRRVK
ncbi:MAG: hypothetical protein EXS32_08410 [Opitutus sp.]|nr:hypothetical protein [Opitutus sp.]